MCWSARGGVPARVYLGFLPHFQEFGEIAKTCNQLYWTRLLWLNGFTDLLELIVAHRSRSAQGRVHFITTSLPVPSELMGAAVPI